MMLVNSRYRWFLSVALWLPVPGLAQSVEMSAADDEIAGLTQQVRQLTAINQTLQQDLLRANKTLSNMTLIDQRNQHLEKQMIELERELQLVQQHNRALSDSANQAWFLRGAGVLLLGLILGVVITSFKRRPTTRWSDL